MDIKTPLGAFYQEALDKAKGLATGEKDTAYNFGGITPRDYWRFNGLRTIADDIYKRALRLMSMTHPDNVRAEELKENVKETGLDIINAGAFLYAEVCCREQEEGPKIKKPDKEEK